MRILVITSRFPYPLEKGDKLRAYHHIKQLSENNEIILVALNDTQPLASSINELASSCKQIKIIVLPMWQRFLNLTRALFSKLPFQVEYFYWSKAQKVIDEIIKNEKPDRIYCQLIRVSEYARPHQSIPKTLDYMDAFSKGIERRIAKSAWYMKPLLRIEHKRLTRYERDIFHIFRDKIIISEQDREQIDHPDRQKIHVIPNGIDTGYFMPLERPKEFDLIFNGNMQYPPNIDSVEFLVKEIMPLVWEKQPKVNLLISGSSPSPKVLRLRSDRVTVSGWVDDIRENFAKARLLIAPMNLSIGLQNKLLEGMAMKIPCITSGLANNALCAEPGKEIIIANTAGEYANQIMMLLHDPRQASEIAENAYRFLLKNFSWKKSVSALENIIHL